MARSSSGASAREEARRLQQEQERKQKRSSLLLRLGVIAVAVVAVAAITLVVLFRGPGASFTEGPAPAAANEQGGITLTSSTELAEGEDIGEIDAENPPTTEGQDGMPPGVEPREEGEPPHVVIYTDAGCPACAQFESAFHDSLAQSLDAGLMTLEYRSVTWVNPPHSPRTANAFACMSDESPENYMGYLGTITAERMNTNEMSNDQLADWAQQSYGVDISECISDGTYRAFAENTTATAQSHGVQGTPTIFIDDEMVPGNEFMNLPTYLEPVLEEYAAEIGETVDTEVEAEEAEEEPEDADEAAEDSDDDE